MGRGDFEFLEAARVGDLLYFEKFFANKKSKALQRYGSTMMFYQPEYVDNNECSCVFLQFAPPSNHL